MRRLELTLTACLAGLLLFGAGSVDYAQRAAAGLVPREPVGPRPPLTIRRAPPERPPTPETPACRPASERLVESVERVPPTGHELRLPSGGPVARCRTFES